MSVFFIDIKFCIHYNCIMKGTRIIAIIKNILKTWVAVLKTPMSPNFVVAL